MPIVSQHPHNLAADKWFRKQRDFGNKATRQINHGWLERQSGQEQTFPFANRMCWHFRNYTQNIQTIQLHFNRSNWMMIRLHFCLTMTHCFANHGTVANRRPRFVVILVPRPVDTYIKWTSFVQEIACDLFACHCLNKCLLIGPNPLPHAIEWY